MRLGCDTSTNGLGLARAVGRNLEVGQLKSMLLVRRGLEVQPLSADSTSSLKN